MSFSLVWVLVCSIAWYALAGSTPNIYFDVVIVILAGYIGRRTFLTESSLARKEDELLSATHRERFRAYLLRRRVWDRLRYCSKCGLVVDPVTHATNSLYEVHELANSKVKGVSLV